jgi:hypothetical protein
MKIPDDEIVPWTMWLVMVVAYIILRLAVWIMGDQL